MNNDVKSDLNQMGEKISNQFEGLADSAEDEFARLYGDEGKLECIVNFVRDRPVVSLGFAAFGGMVLAWMLKCLCRSSKSTKD